MSYILDHIADLKKKITVGQLTIDQAMLQLAQAVKDSCMLQKVPETAAVYLPGQLSRLSPSQLRTYNMAAAQQLLISKALGAGLKYE
jgi:hypothetical protein